MNDVKVSYEDKISLYLIIISLTIGGLGYLGIGIYYLISLFL